MYVHSYIIKYILPLFQGGAKKLFLFPEEIMDYLTFCMAFITISVHASD